MRPQPELLRAFGAAQIRYVLAGVAGANCWARDGSLVAAHHTHEIVVEPVADTLTKVWCILRGLGYTLREGFARLPDPLPGDLARDVAASLRSTSAYRLRDQTLVQIHTTIPGFTFEDLWREHRTFRAGDVELHVARLRHILASMHERNVGGDKLAVARWSQGMHDLFVPDPVMTRILAEHRARHGIVRAPAAP